jgi:hypothetical protein
MYAVSALAESIAKTLDESQSVSDRLRRLEADKQALSAHNAQLVERARRRQLSVATNLDSRRGELIRR